MTNAWQDGEKGWRVDADDLADITFAAQSICKEIGVPFDPYSVLVFADYEGNVRLNIRGLNWKFDEEKGSFEVKKNPSGESPRKCTSGKCSASRGLVTAHKSQLIARCEERGYALNEVMPCVTHQNGDEWTIDTDHPSYPRTHKDEIKL